MKRWLILENDITKEMVCLWLKSYHRINDILTNEEKKAGWRVKRNNLKQKPLNIKEWDTKSALL